MITEVGKSCSYIRTQALIVILISTIALISVSIMYQVSAAYTLFIFKILTYILSCRDLTSYLTMILYSIILTNSHLQQTEALLTIHPTHCVSPGLKSQQALFKILVYIHLRHSTVKNRYIYTDAVFALAQSYSNHFNQLFL